MQSVPNVATGESTQAKASKDNTTEKTNQKTVLLYTFPAVPHVYNISPFAIKVESFLRLHAIPYDTVYSVKFGPKRMVPFIRLVPFSEKGDKGEVIPDSNVIIPRLKAEFGVDRDAELTAAERAVGHAFTRMIEEHTAQIGFHYRYALHMEELCDALEIQDRFYAGLSPEERRKRMEPMLKSQPDYTKNKTKYRGLGVHTEEELWSFSNDDLLSISHFLDDKPWFFGVEATTIDCVLFGHLVQFLYTPLESPQKSFLHENCPNVVRLVERFRENFWPDWEVKFKVDDSHQGEQSRAA